MVQEKNSCTIKIIFNFPKRPPALTDCNSRQLMQEVKEQSVNR